VFERMDEFFAGPAGDRDGARQLVAINVNHGGVRRAQFLDVFECRLLRARWCPLS
jgi:hypothetical protein